MSNKKKKNSGVNADKTIIEKIPYLRVYAENLKVVGHTD